MFCPNCGQQVADGNLFCHKCGALMPSGVPDAGQPAQKKTIDPVPDINPPSKPAQTSNKIPNPYIMASGGSDSVCQSAQPPVYQPSVQTQSQPVPPPYIPQPANITDTVDENGLADSVEEAEEEMSGSDMLCSVMFYIAAFAACCALAKFLGYPEIHDYLRPSGAKSKIFHAVANFLGGIPDWLVYPALYGSMCVIFFSLKKYLGGFKIASGVKVMLEMVIYTTLGLGVLSLIPETGNDAVDYYISGFIEVSLAIECIVLGSMLLHENTGGMAALMMVYGIVTSGIFLYALTFDEWDLPEFWVLLILGMLLYGALILMLKSVVAFLGVDVDD